MSVRALVWAFNQPCPSPSAKLVLIKLADHANEDGQCWPSQSRVAADTGLTRETVNRQIKALAEVGLIVIQQQSDRAGKHPNRYFLLCDFLSHGCDLSSQPHVISDHNPCDLSSHKPTIEPSVEPSSPPLSPQWGERVSYEKEFEVWWSHVPRRVGKGQAARAYLTARKKASAEALLAGIKAYAEARAGQDPQFTAHPATWLNGERWLDGESTAEPAKDNRPLTPPPIPEELWGPEWDAFRTKQKLEGLNVGVCDRGAFPGDAEAATPIGLRHLH